MTRLLCFLLFAVFIYAQPTIYIVRHAEKTDGWPGKLGQFQPLSEMGVKTSNRLEKQFKDIKFSAIYTSNTTRTMQTAFPTSKSQKVSITVHDAVADTSKIADFITELNQKYKSDESVLIVSHSNLIPYYLFQFGVTEKDFSTYKITQTQSKSWYLTDYYGVIFKIEKMKIEMIEF